MKKLLSTFIAISFATTAVLAQDAPDSKSVRFGVFVRGTPSWYGMPASSNYSKGGAIFGMGFGLNLEFRVTDVVSFQTGIGGDFDGGKIKYTDSRSHPNYSDDIYTGYLLDKTPAYIDITGHSYGDFNTNIATGQYTRSYLISRQIHTTYITIPLVLKMKTKEISGFKYFIDFGGSIGVLASAKADDNTEDVDRYGVESAGTHNGLSIYKDCNPVRIGLNVGGGAEYRLAGTTSLYLSVNFVNSFISTVKTTSIYNATAVDYSHNSQGTITYAAQKLNTNGIQINIGVLF
jgi:hypothetical protein